MSPHLCLPLSCDRVGKRVYLEESASTFLLEGLFEAVNHASV